MTIPANISTGRGPDNSATSTRHADLKQKFGDEIGECVFRVQQHLLNDQAKGGTGVMVLTTTENEVLTEDEIDFVIQADSIQRLQHDISAWADTVIPNRTPESALRKLVEHELPELLASGINDPLEFGDVLILVLDLANMAGIDILAAARAKLEINRTREWAIDPETDLMSHVKKLP